MLPNSWCPTDVHSSEQDGEWENIEEVQGAQIFLLYGSHVLKMAAQMGSITLDQKGKKFHHFKNKVQSVKHYILKVQYPFKGDQLAGNLVSLKWYL